jgi:endonuclease/exonuclease/phosphatase family metal-dependent hydrolase
MPFYNALDSRKPKDRAVATNLLRLKLALDESVSGKTLDKTLLVASWNLREFGGAKSGGREQEPLLYIAEIMSRFDLIAVQEVRNNLQALDDLMRLLGGWWKYLVSDVSQGASGNQERHAFVYDTRKLSFGGLAGELVPPPTKNADGTLHSDFLAARTPYCVGFRAGWFKFSICTQHMYYGESKPDDPQRVKEAKQIVKLLKSRMKEKDRWAANAILLGDFNVFTTEDETFKAITNADFVIPDGLFGKYTNAKLDKPFDQIALIAPDQQHQIDIKGITTGVFPFYDHVYRDADKGEYLPDETDRKYREWRTYKMSDHLPLWIELPIDFSSTYLTAKTKAPKPA